MEKVFDVLDERIKDLLWDIEPSETQISAIPPILDGKNVLLVAPTGTGKTEAAMLPVFHGILKEKGRGVSAVYITPLRALNRDMLRRLEEWGKKLGIDVKVRHGDTSKYERRRQVENPPDVLITTPETFQILFVGKRLREILRDVRYVILDEVHELASSKRGVQLSIALERLERLRRGKIQRIGLSATVGNREEMARFMVGNERDCEIIDVPTAKSYEIEVLSPYSCEKDEKRAEELFVNSEMMAHLNLIRDTIDESRSILIFTNTRQMAEMLGSRLKMLGSSCDLHHGSLSREIRIKTEESFKRGDLKALICTSSMELGIDVGNVDNVIQYTSPREVGRLLQRMGRSGHGIQKISRGKIIATSPDDIMESWAIARRGLYGELSVIPMMEDSYDVLANQICGSLIERKSVDVKEIFNCVKRAYPYRNLGKEKFMEVLRELKRQRLVFFDFNNFDEEDEEKVVKIGGRTYQYYYENISMILDEKKFDVVDIVRREKIGSLDESFVISSVRRGSVFITRGDMWRIIDLDDEKIEVEPIKDPGGEIPNWVGEEIPVPFEVAMEVGRIRGIFSSGMNDERELLKRLSDYPVEENSFSKVYDLMRRQEGFIVPTDKVITIEGGENSAIINLCGGHRVNETLGEALSALISARFGMSVGMEIDPYRIKFTFPRRISADLIRRILIETDPGHLEGIIKLSLKNISLLKWKIIGVARRFGALSKGFDHRKISMDKFLHLFEDSIIFEEAAKEVLYDKMDLKNAKKVLEEIRKEKIKVLTSKITPIGSSGYSTSRALFCSEAADDTIIGVLKNRIMEDSVILFCLNCKRWRTKKKVKNVSEEIVCPICESRLIAALKPWEEEEIKLIKRGGGYSKEDEKRVKKVYRNANIVLSCGREAVIALASRGVGPDTAAKIVDKMRESEEEFYRDILDAERNFARTKRFWD